MYYLLFLGAFRGSERINSELMAADMLAAIYDYFGDRVALEMVANCVDRGKDDWSSSAVRAIRELASRVPGDSQVG